MMAKRAAVKKAAIKRPAKAAMSTGGQSAKSAEAQFDEFLAKFTPEVEATARQALRKMRARLPGAIELVYDNYNALAIGFSPTEHASDAIFSIALYPRWVSLFFLISGTKLRDPECYLKGSGSEVRHIVLEEAATLDDPAVLDLMEQALEISPKQIDAAQPRRLVIKSISAKQRPRRPG
jgi:hypothetical protein